MTSSSELNPDHHVNDPWPLSTRLSSCMRSFLKKQSTKSAHSCFCVVRRFSEFSSNCYSALTWMTTWTKASLQCWVWVKTIYEWSRQSWCLILRDSIKNIKPNTKTQRPAKSFIIKSCIPWYDSTEEQEENNRNHVAQMLRPFSVEKLTCANRQTEGVWFDVLEGIKCDDAGQRAAGITAYFSFIWAFIGSLFVLRGSKTARGQTLTHTHKVSNGKPTDEQTLVKTQTKAHKLNLSWEGGFQL